MDIEKHRAFRVERHRAFYATHAAPDPDEWLAQTREVEPLVRRIQNRGGKVAFVRLPTTGEYYELDQRQYPRERYWDRFAALTSAQMLHFQDVPALRDFDCPDGSHLDYRAKPRFTGLLIKALERQGLFAIGAVAPPVARRNTASQIRADAGAQNPHQGG